MEGTVGFGEEGLGGIAEHCSVGRRDELRCKETLKGRRTRWMGGETTREMRRKGEARRARRWVRPVGGGLSEVAELNKDASVRAETWKRTSDGGGKREEQDEVLALSYHA